MDEKLPDLIRVENKFYHCTKYAHHGLSCDTTNVLLKLILTFSDFMPMLRGYEATESRALYKQSEE